MDDEIEDLACEIAVLVSGFRECEGVKALTKEEADRLIGDVEQHANREKHSIRRMFSSLSEAYEVFDEIAGSIRLENSDGESDKEFQGDGDENDDNDSGIATEDDEEIDDEEAFGEDEDDDDYRTVDALADEESEDEEDDLELDDFEEMLTDEECLHAARFEATGILAAYEAEMNAMNLSQETLSRRLETLRRMMFQSADVIVDIAVDRFVQSYFAAAMTDIHVRLMETIDDADLATADIGLIATAMAEIITVGVVARQALYTLPFTRRDAIESTCDNIEGEIREIIRHVQMINSGRPEIADALNDLDIDGFYDSDDDEELNADDEETEEEDDEDEVEDSSLIPTPARGGKSKAKKVTSSKAAPDAASKMSGSKRKAADVEESAPVGSRRSSRRRN